jgi:disease resistance protein RPS2
MDFFSAFLVEAGKFLTSYMFSRIATVIKFHENTKTLESELGKLNSRKNDMLEYIELAKAEGKHPTMQANVWLIKVEEIEREVRPMLEASLNKSTCTQDCCLDLNMCNRYQLSKSMAQKVNEVKELIDSCSFHNVVADRMSPIKAVTVMPAPSLVGQKAAEERVARLVGILNDDGIKIIGVWGMGGVGKTTLVKNLNNMLNSSLESFDMVIWVEVSKDLDLRTIQSHIAERLNLELNEGESTQQRANKLFRSLIMKKKCLLILDEVWEKIDLDIVGVPQGHDQANCKILLTTRSLAVCRQMMTNADFRVDVLNEEDAWNLFVQNAGDIAESEGIHTLARAIAKKCCGLPLAINAVGKSLRNRTVIELWKNALSQLQCSVPHYGSSEEEMYLPLKLSYNSLPSKILQQCFLYCSLYPESFSINISELIQCWIADGLIDAHQTLEESFNNGIALVENLKDTCMLEQGEGSGTVKMHYVLRDVAKWITLIEKKSGFSCQPNRSLHKMPDKLQKNCRRVSFMNNSITRLPSQLLGCSELTVLFLQGNPLRKIPDGFFREVRALRFLNLSGTHITSLPPSLLQLGELHALLLRDCPLLDKLPPLGALEKLQLLDLSGTRLRELPKELKCVSSKI